MRRFIRPNIHMYTITSESTFDYSLNAFKKANFWGYIRLFVDFIFLILLCVEFFKLMPSGKVFECIGMMWVTVQCCKLWMLVLPTVVIRFENQPKKQ